MVDGRLEGFLLLPLLISLSLLLMPLLLLGLESRSYLLWDLYTP